MQRKQSKKHRKKVLKKRREKGYEIPQKNEQKKL